MDMNTKDRLYEICSVAKLLEEKESSVKWLKEQFRVMSDEITKLTGYELWTNHDDDGVTYFWRNRTWTVASIPYPSREDAITALIRDNIEWA